MHSAPGTLRIAALLTLATGSVALATLLGHWPVRLAHVLDPESFFWRYRVPRTITGALVGAGLTLGGVVFQTLFRNPLATPYTLGIDAGAALGAAIGMVTGVHGLWHGVPVLSLLAFLGALGAMGLVLLMSRLRSGGDVADLLLAGVCISYLCTAAILLVMVLAERTVTGDIITWTMGSLAAARQRVLLLDRAAWEILAVLVPAAALVIYHHRALDLLGMGDHLAATRGVPVAGVFWSCFLAIGLLTAVIVSHCGPIGFVGLIVPHLARRVVGRHTLELAIGGSLLGGAFLALCDGLARLGTYELPVGVITSLIGSLLFFYLLARRPSARSPAG